MKGLLFLTTALLTTALIPAQAQMQNDPFLWLEDLISPSSLTWVQQHNQKSLSTLTQDPRYGQMTETLTKIFSAEDKLQNYTAVGDFVYMTLTNEQHQLGVLRRMALTEFLAQGKDWQDLLDMDALAKTEGINWYLTSFSPCPFNANRILINLSQDGKDAFTLREFDVSTKSFLKEGFALHEGKGAAEWLNENTLVLAHTTLGKITTSGYPAQAFLWKRGIDLSQATFLTETKEDETGMTPMAFHNGGAYQLVLAAGHDFWSASYLVVTPEGQLAEIITDQKSSLYGFFQDSAILVASQDFTQDKISVPSGSIYAVQKSPSGEKVRVLYSPNANASIQNLDVNENGILITQMADVKSEILFISDLNQKASKVDLPFQNMAIEQMTGTKFGCLYQGEGFLNAPFSFWLNTKNGITASILQQTPARFENTDLVVEQKFAKSLDGTQIPYFIVHKKNLPLDGSNPTAIWAYGGFNIALQPFYLTSYGQYWLNQGGVFVLANIRGGNEYGPAWHDSAILENKQKSYDDLIAVSENLIAQKITSPRRLGIMGGSNGGLLVGAVTMQRPDLYHAALSMNPLLDMMRYHKLFAGAIWIGEFGNPDDPHMREIILKYSPYQNIQPATQYPTMLITTTSSDDRVHPGHARKFAAKMESQNHEVLFYENTEGGHNLGTPESIAREHALRLIYLIKYLMD